MSGSALDVKRLREATGAGMMDCKRALDETKGDFEGAVEWLRKKGLSAAAKKSGRVAAEGLIAVAVSGNKGAIIELNSETDFVAKNEQFQKMAKEIAGIALQSGSTIDALRQAKHASGKSVDEAVKELVGVIGENLQLRRSSTLEVSKGAIASYVHSAIAPGLGKIGVLVALESDAAPEKLAEVGKQVAMHVAAARPESLDVASLNPALVEKEREIFRDQAKASGKPAEIIEKMIEGRIRKYYEQVVLTEQLFVIDGKTKISDVLKAAAAQAGAPITLKGYTYFVLGDGIQKEETDFAAEVAKVVNG